MPTEQTSIPSADQIEIRDIEEADVPKVAQFWNESADLWPAGYSNGVPVTAERIREGGRLNGGINLFLAIELTNERERVVGYCSLTADREGDREAAYVALLNVHPVALGRGVGRRLLRRALDRTIELGFRRLDLHTWAGNVRAVPLYKKMGFFWVPETSVRMENFLPSLLQHPLTKRFLGGADWYRCLRRELTQAPDDEKLDGRSVYTYDFADEDRRLRWVIDRATRQPVAFESDDLSASLRVPTKALTGRRQIASVELASRAPESRRSTIFCRGEGAVSGDRSEAVGLPGTRRVELELAGQCAGGEGRLIADLAVGNDTLRLSAGVQVVPPVDVALATCPLPLVPGKRVEVPLAVSNNSSAELQGTLVLGVPADLTVEPRQISLSLGPDETADVSFAVAGGAGAHELSYDFVDAGAGRSLQQPRTLTIPIVGPGHALAYHSADKEVVETAELRYATDRTGRVVVTDRQTGQQVVSLSASYGPPYTPADFGLHHWKALAEPAADGLGRIRLNASLEGQPIALDVDLEVGVDEVVWTARARNLGTRAASGRCMLSVASGAPPGEREQTTVPHRTGLVSSSWPEFPDWSHIVTPSSEYAEGWLAFERPDRTIGVAWSEAAGVTWGWAGPSLELDFGQIEPGQTAQAPEVHVYVGRGDWREVRRRWRLSCAPSAPVEAPRPRQVVDVTATPSLGEAGAAKTAVSVQSFLARPQRGSLRLSAPTGWQLSAESLDVPDVCLGRSWSTTVSAEPAEEGPCAAAVIGRFVSNLAEWPVEVPLIRLGGEGPAPQVRPLTEAGAEVLDVDNGWWSFRVAPGFAGSVTRLTRLGVDQLISAFPDARALSWGHPWYGGIVPSLHPLGGGRHSSPGGFDLAFRERPSWSTVVDEGRLGVAWSGVRLSGESHRWRGLTVDVEYLTTTGSNALLAIIRLRNESRAAVRGIADLTAFTAVGGSVEAAEVHTVDEAGQAETLRRAPYRTFPVPSASWAAVRDARSGGTVSLVRTGDSGSVYALDWGRDGAFLGLWGEFDLRAGESRELSCGLFLTPDLESAMVYRALAASAD